MWYILLIVLIVFLYIFSKTALIWPSANGLRVLMYHHVLPDRQDGLTVKVTEFRRQIEWLHQHRFQIISPADLLRHQEHGTPLPSRSVFFTFDDAYTDFMEFALPILKEYSIRPLVFVPTAFVGKTNEWDALQEKILNADQIRKGIEADWGFHSHAHLNYRTASLQDLRVDLAAMNERSQSHGFSMFPAFAYPYGAYPKDKAKLDQLHQELKKCGVKAAFRIGNRINRLPLKKPYLIERLDIRGDESFRRFRFKMLYGKWI